MPAPLPLLLMTMRWDGDGDGGCGKDGAAGSDMLLLTACCDMCG
jgi:hypothetical protein